MKHNLIDELFCDNYDTQGDIMSKIEVLPISNTDESDDFMFVSEPNCEDIIPILPITSNVVFPGTLAPINASRKSSIKLLQEASNKNLYIGVVTQRNENENELPKREELYNVGCIARVVKVFELPGDEVIGILHGVCCFQLGKIVASDPYLLGEQSPVTTADSKNVTTKDREMASLLVRQYTAYLKSTNPKDMSIRTIKEIKGPRMAINFIASHIDASVQTKQSILEMKSYTSRVKRLLEAIKELTSVVNLRNEIQEKTRASMDRQQREYFLNQQMHVIQEELGGPSAEADVTELRDRAARMNWPEAASRHFEHELGKLARTQPNTPDYSVQLNYLTFMLDLPWNISREVNLDLEKARKILDRNHFGLDKIKDRIIETMAVLKLSNQQKSPVLCLVGPPGTGKTSLGKSIADALGREYVRVALGGVHDEAEVRGHRRTYVGAMPGRIINGMKRAGVNNPVFVLDEIDKVQSVSHNGDPMAALLEALDPEQNNAFHDNYLDIDYDLSHVLFIATANTTAGIHPALLDRMEIIEVSGYVMEEKLSIAKRYLVPRQLKETGFKSNDYTFSNEVTRKIIEDYTRESGVRQLEKQIGKVIRNRAVQVGMNQPTKKKIGVGELREVLGLPLHQMEHRGREPRVAVVTGLAWTQVGGTILFIEACTSKGKGTLSMTGNLGDVMKESATLAYEYVKANAAMLGIDEDRFENTNLHIHVPEGATPKDGPSAGITIFTAIVSAFTGRKVRPEMAMTGEITLRGAVTPVGGIREKILAAKRAEITDLVLCEENRRDVDDIKPEYLKGLTFHYISEMSEVLPLALID